MKDSYKKIAKFGFVAKGSIYAIAGVMTFLGAVNMGGDKSGKGEVFNFLQEQSYGKVLLAILGLGLVSYAIWRFIQSIQNPEGIDNDTKGTIKRIAFFISGLIYLGFAFVSFKHMMGSSGGNNSGGGMVDTLGETTVTILFVIVGIALAAKSIYHFIEAYKGKFLDDFTATDEKKKDFIENAGYLGYYSRAVVIGIIAYFFLHAGIYSGSNEIKGTQEAFSFIEESGFGTILLAATAGGLACYGFFLIALARYKKFN